MPHGITGAERDRFDGATHLMLRLTRSVGSLWLLSTTKERSTYEAIAVIQKRITRLQGGHNLFRYSAWVFETRPRLHAHFIFVGNSEIAVALRRSTVCAGADVRPVTDLEKLKKKYLMKESTPQARYGRSDLGYRIPGSHRLPGGPHDRVHMSSELYRDGLEAGLFQDWRRTNAKRKPVAERKEYQLRRLFPKKAPTPSGQILLFPEMSKPVARLQSFGGGIVPPPVAAEIEFRRRQHGWSQRKLAKLIGRSQGQLANALRGHDPMSAASVNRLRDALLTAPHLV